MPQITAKGYLKLPFTIAYDSEDVSQDGMLKRLLHVVMNPEGAESVKGDWEIVVEQLAIEPLTNLFKDMLDEVKVNPAWFVRDPVPAEYCPKCGKPFYTLVPPSAVLMPHWYKDNKGYYVCTQCASVVGNEHDDNPLPTMIEETYTEHPHKFDECPVCDAVLVDDVGMEHYKVGEEGDIYCDDCGECIGDLSLGEHWPE